MRPTAKQLAYLRALAARTATTFAYHPKSRGEASREIDRLHQLPAANNGEGFEDRLAVDTSAGSGSRR